MAGASTFMKTLRRAMSLLLWGLQSYFVGTLSTRGCSTRLSTIVFTATSCTRRLGV
ncbi:hypothetical protein PF008_g11360 [Phytophthora fragariae]|uniref:Uncharacterized protein n=1 Tax=Phytophthora fragariae TaxID=53985 RepID=A0A6G0RSK3_9STRA|nr:hypothetical protein PF008_g11360 [Phytophthora fragariae]